MTAMPFARLIQRWLPLIIRLFFGFWSRSRRDRFLQNRFREELLRRYLPDRRFQIKYEKTKFTDDYVTVCYPLNPGENIVRAGEDIRKGAVLAECGDVIDPGLAGVLAAQGEAMPLVYKIPKVAFFGKGFTADTGRFIALATDLKVDTDLPCFGFCEIKEIFRFILKKNGKTRDSG